MPRPPASADESRNEGPAEGSREKRSKGPSKASEEKLDRAVEMTFPASDPPLAGHATGNEGASQPQGRQAPVISKEEIDRASAGGTQGRQPMGPGDDAPPGTAGTGDICPMCGGSGQVKGAKCSDCEGRGKVIKGISGA